MRFLAYWSLRYSDLCPSACTHDDELCQRIHLERAMDSPAGALLQRALDLDFMLDAGFRVTPHEISAEEFRALRVLRGERNKYRQQTAEKPPSPIADGIPDRSPEGPV